MLCAFVVSACASRTLTIAPATPPASTSPAPQDTRPTTDSELDAQRFRSDFGLRSDLEWIRAVAADPTSDRTTYGVPLTPAEIAELARRSITLEAFRDQVIEYASAQPDYAGAWIDQLRGGVLVVQFAGTTLVHQAKILSMVRPGAPIEVRQVRWRLSEIQAWQDRVGAEEAWFLTIPAYLYANGPDEVQNRLTVTVSSADPDVESKILAHFGWTDEQVVVHSDRTGALLLQPGSLQVTAVDRTGAPVEGLACVAIPDVAGAYDPRPLPMPTTDEDGICTIEAAAGAYTIQLERGEAPPTVIATGRATIAAKHLTEVTITVP